jgi:invasion protein IalB
MIQTLPLGVRIEPGTSIISSKKMIAPGRYTNCTQAGCQAIARITDLDLEAMLTSTENSLVFMNKNAQQLVLPLSVKGLKKGLNYIK